MIRRIALQLSREGSAPFVRIKFVSASNCKCSRRPFASTVAWRQSSTTQSSEGNRGGAAPLSDEEIIRRANWRSNDHYERLGVSVTHLDGKDDAEIQLLLKRHYRVLVKHYHPDSSSAPKEGTEAFKSVSEAYEVLVKGGGSEGSGGSAGSSSSSRQYGNDFKRRKGQIRFLGESLGLFLIGSCIYVIITARHNRERLGSSYLSHLIGIFILLQLFPRLLSAAILFAYHSSDMVHATELELQSRGSLVTERTSPKSIKLRVEGYDDSMWQSMRIQVELCEVPASGVVAAANGKETNVVQPSGMKTEVILFDKGNREVTLPILPAPRKNHLSVKVLCDDGRKFVVCDKSLVL